MFLYATQAGIFEERRWILSDFFSELYDKRMTLDEDPHLTNDH